MIIKICVALEDTTVTILEDAEPEWLRSLKEKVPESPDCGVGADDRIYGGKEAGYRQFSWMVLLQFLRRKMRINFIFEWFDVILFSQLGIRWDFIVAAV